MAVATEADAVIEAGPVVGQLPLARRPRWRMSGARSGRSRRPTLERAVIVSDERTLAQDPAFAIRAIVDIAIRALSPAVNDPTTACQAPGHPGVDPAPARRGGRRARAGCTTRAGALRVLPPRAGMGRAPDARAHGDPPLRRVIAPDGAPDAGAAPPGARAGPSPPSGPVRCVHSWRCWKRPWPPAFTDPAERALASAADHMGLGGVG